MAFTEKDIKVGDKVLINSLQECCWAEVIEKQSGIVIINEKNYPFNFIPYCWIIDIVKPYYKIDRIPSINWKPQEFLIPKQEKTK